MTFREQPDQLLLLYSDRSDPVCCAVVDHPQRFNLEVIAVSLDQLLSEVTVGPRWTWRGRTIEPPNTAVVNRLPFGNADNIARLGTVFQWQQFASWLHRELQRFAYASSLPTDSSLIGGYGSLLDQWEDLPRLVGGLRVPEHRAPGAKQALNGDVYVVSPWRFYSLGSRMGAGQESNSRTQLAYVRPAGYLVHASQVGAAVLFGPAPPNMTPAQRDCIAAFAESMAHRSPGRILEHAFFVGSELPVFYSTCPVPVVTGKLESYAGLVAEGVHDDINRRRRRTAG